MTEKDKDLLEMMKGFKKLNEKEKGFIFGLIEGISICKNDSIPESYEIKVGAACHI